MNPRLVSSAVRLMDWSGVNAFFRLLNRSNAIILMYHGVCAAEFTLLKDYDERHTPVALFRQQLNAVRRSGFRFATLSELVTRIKHRQSIGRLAVVTFDDGFRNVVRHAYPVMKEFGAKGCFFVVSNFVGQRTLLWTDLVETFIRFQKEGPLRLTIQGETVRYSLDSTAQRNFAMTNLKYRLRRLPNDERIRWMEKSGITSEAFVDVSPEEFAPADWKELQSLDQSILEIGSHTRNHPNCDTIGTSLELDAEIAGSKLEIESRIGRKIEHFCYPAGAFNPAVIEAVRKAGFQSAVTTMSGFTRDGADLFRLQRITPDSELHRFKAIMSGTLPWLQRLTHRVQVQP